VPLPPHARSDRLGGHWPAPPVLQPTGIVDNDRLPSTFATVPSRHSGSFQSRSSDAETPKPLRLQAPERGNIGQVTSRRDRLSIVHPINDPTQQHSGADLKMPNSQGAWMRPRRQTYLMKMEEIDMRFEDIGADEGHARGLTDHARVASIHAGSPVAALMSGPAWSRRYRLSTTWRPVGQATANGIGANLAQFNTIRGGVATRSSAWKPIRPIPVSLATRWTADGLRARGLLESANAPLRTVTVTILETASNQIRSCGQPRERQGSIASSPASQPDGQPPQ